LIVIAVAIAFGRRKIAVLLVVILNDFGRRLFATILGRLALFGLLAGSTHVRVPALNRRIDLNLTAIDGHINLQMRNLHCLFPPFGVKRGEDCKDIQPNTESSMKKPKIEAEEPQPRKIIRADKAPTDGYSLVVDGHFKSHHATVEAAEEAGMALKNQYQMLQVQVYDAATKTRSMIEWPAPV
jgi:hypothetical protein